MAGGRRRLVLIYGLTFAAILVFALGPLIAAIGSGLIAQQAGCALDEGSVHPCIVMGKDIGDSLYTLFVAGWFGLLTLPAGGFALLVWLAALLVHLTVRRLGARR